MMAQPARAKVGQRGTAGLDDGEAQERERADEYGRATPCLHVVSHPLRRLTARTGVAPADVLSHSVAKASQCGLGLHPKMVKE